MTNSPESVRNGETDSKLKASVLLPSNDYVVHVWKVKSGTAVRKGETVAVAARRGSVNAVAATGATVSTGDKPASAQHKRPKRRRKIQPATVAPAPPTAAAAATPPVVPPPQTNLAGEKPKSMTAQFVQRLAEKMDQGTDQAQQSATSVNTSNSSANPELVDTTISSSTAKSSETIPLLAAADGILRVPQTPPPDQPLVVGYIEECMHPGFLGGLCVVCGVSVVGKNNAKVSDSISPENKDEGSSVSQVTVSGGVTMTISRQEGRKIAQQDSERLLKQRKLSLVLDLDHTLVHATSDPRARQYHSTADDVRTLRLPLMEGAPIAPPPGQPQTPMWMQHFAKLRPRIKEFLEIVQPMYELTVYTAGTRHYAEEIAIVLCRHLVGSRRDLDDLERLRYQVHLAENEYRKHKSLGEQDNGKMTETGADKKRKAEDMTNHDGTSEPAQKKKKVSFGPPSDDSGPNVSSQPNAVNNRSDHMTLERLQELRNELKEAEELERKAWEVRRKVFGSRVVSRNDVGDLGRDVKSLKRIFPCGGTMAAVIDDREDVWANASDNSDDTIRGEPPENLLLVRPYHWQPFVGFADINNAAGADLSGNGPGGRDTDPMVETDVQLIWTSRILRGLHRRYYSQEENNRKTVPEILSQMRREVLRGSSLVLSGLVPLHKQTVAANSARPPIVRYVQSLGGQLLDTIQPGVTHVVAAKDGTDKALAARKIPGCVLVKPAWLVECYWSMTRRDVKPHLMGKGEGPDASHVKRQQQLPLKESEANKNVHSSDTDSEDDELAAALEEEMMNSD